MGFFKISMGLRQVDSFSPFLILLITEALGGLLNRALERGLIEGFEIGDGCNLWMTFSSFTKTLKDGSEC